MSGEDLPHGAHDRDAGPVRRGLLKRLRSRLFSIVRRGAVRSWPVAAIHDAGRMERLEQMIRHIQRDVERIKLHANVVLQPGRALSLLATGYRIYVDPSDTGGAVNLLTDGKYEEDELRAFRRYLRPDTVFLDIGANYGYYSLVAAPYVRHGGRIVGFEPNPHIHDLFSASIFINGFSDVIEARRAGAYDRNGTLAFEIDEASPGGAHIVAANERPSPQHLVIDVPTVRLDDAFPDDFTADLVKIDVEGHEEHVLRGMRSIIARSPDILIFMEFIFYFFADEEAFRRIVRLITQELGLRVSRVLHGGFTAEVDMASLRGASCTLVLSKAELTPRPDLTIFPEQLIRSEHARLAGGELVWRRQPGAGRMIAHGPYFYLPRGRYRLVLDADLDGDFLCRIQENYGDLLWEGRIGASGACGDIELAMDASRLEIVLLADGDGDSSLRFRSAEFWPA